MARAKSPSRNQSKSPAELIKSYIDTHSMKQEQFAELAGVTQGMVSLWERGKRPVPAKRAILIEQATRGALTRHELCPQVFSASNAA